MMLTEIQELYKTISALYGKAPITNDELKILAEVYKPYSAVEIRQALEEYLKTKTFLPKPADLIKIAEKNRSLRRQAQYEEEQRQIRYDKNGRQIYECDFCRDSGYMLVDDDPLYPPSATKCICRHPIKSLEYQQNGRVRLRLKSKHRRSSGYYVFDSTKMMFVREDAYRERKAREQNCNIDITDMGDVTAAMLEQLDLPF